MSFNKIREKNYPEMKMLVQVYEHDKTGAIHYHTQYDTIQNTFNVSFRTLPQSSNGVPHILEHSVLNGSKKYPLHGVFFAMQGRNFETFSNAMTGLDTTQYPFSAIDKKGFFNLLSVYLDAVFFPNLEKEVFLQEGWRYTLENNDVNGNLQYSGVVYNEMKGAYANPMSVAFVGLLKNAFKNTQYENYSGGDPLEIPNLSYEEFIDFHKKYYHPSNAIFYTFGSIPVEEIHEKFEEWVLNHFDKQVVDNTINVKNLAINGQSYHGTHPSDSGYIYFKGYEIEDFKNVQDFYELTILTTLLQSGKSDYRNIFMQKDIGVSAESIWLLPVNKSVLTFYYQMDEDNVKDIEMIMSQYFEELIKNGISAEELNNVFDSVELQVREGEAGSNNLGLSTISQYMDAERHGIKEIEDINSLVLFKELKKKLQNKEYFNSLIKKYFIDNKKQFSYLSKADIDFNKKMEAKAQEKLKEKLLTLTLEEKQSIIEESKKLEEIRLKEKDLNILPKLNLTDVTIKYPEERNYQLANIEKSSIYSFISNTKGVDYIKLYYPVQDVEINDIFTQNLVVEIIENLNLKGLSLEDTTLWKDTQIGKLDIGFSLNQTDTGLKANYVVDTKGLSENTSVLLDKVFKFLKEVEFNQELVVSAISNVWRDHITSYQDNAHSFAITEAQSGFSDFTALKKKMIIDYKMNFLKNVVEQIENNDFSIVEKLQRAYEDMFSVAPTVFFCGAEHSNQILMNKLVEQKELFTNEGVPLISFKIEKETNSSAIDLNIPINHVAYVLPVASGDEKDGGALKVLSNYIAPYLHTNVREKGGAYGANASYNTNGLFTLYSYRDPNTLKTVDVFKGLKKFLNDTPISQEELSVSKLNIIKQFNKPQEEIHKAIKQFHRIMKEKGSDEKMLINSVLSTTSQDIVNIANKYFGNEASLAVATNAETINEHLSDWNTLILSEKKPTLKTKI